MQRRTFTCMTPLCDGAMLHPDHHNRGSSMAESPPEKRSQPQTCLLDLSPDCLRLVLRQLRPGDVCTLSTVCSRLAELATQVRSAWQHEHVQDSVQRSAIVNWISEDRVATELDDLSLPPGAPGARH